jgi:hypothetical protein
MASKLLNLLSLTSLAIMACSFGAEPVTALSSGHQVRDGLRGHDALAKRKRSTNSKRCKVRSAPAASSTDSSTDGSTSSANTDIAAATTAAPTSTWSDSTTSWSSTSSSAAAATSSASSSSSGSGKVCLAWPNGDQSYLSDYHTGKTTYLYSWSETGPSNLDGFTFVPQLWGDKNAVAFGSTAVAGYSNVALGFNEPNESGQSNMTPEHAAALWIQYIEPLKALGYRLGSPATSSNPNGLTWMQNFFTACNGGCNPDFMALHWYDVTIEGFQEYVELWHTTFNKNIWITEYAVQNFNGGAQQDYSFIQGFMGTVNSWMDSLDYVEQYCWFGAMLDLQGVNTANSLMNSDGSPSQLGYQFLSS